MESKFIPTEKAIARWHDNWMRTWQGGKPADRARRRPADPELPFEQFIKQHESRPKQEPTWFVKQLEHRAQAVEKERS